MNIFISFSLLLFLVAIVSWKIIRANRVAARAAREKKREREQKEREILSRLEKIRKTKSDMDLARGAIAKDPERAAKALSRMMKKG